MISQISMDSNLPIIAQLLTIVGKLILMCFIALRFKAMKYDFWYIIIRYVFYGDAGPMQWLSKNYIYLLYFVYEINQCIILVGLIHELRLGKLYEKLPELSIGGPINAILLCIIFFELFSKLDNSNNTLKAFINTFKYKDIKLK